MDLLPLSTGELVALAAAIVLFTGAALILLLTGNKPRPQPVGTAPLSVGSSKLPAPSPYAGATPGTIRGADELQQLHTALSYHLLHQGSVASAVMMTQRECAPVMETLLRLYNMRTSLPVEDDLFRQAQLIRARALEQDAATIEQNMRTARNDQNRLYELLNATETHWKAVSGGATPPIYGEPNWCPPQPVSEPANTDLARLFASVAKSQTRQPAAGAYKLLAVYGLIDARRNFLHHRERIDILLGDAASFDVLAAAGIVQMSPPRAKQKLEELLRIRYGA